MPPCGTRALTALARVFVKQRKKCDVSTIRAAILYPAPEPSETFRPLPVITAEPDRDVVDEWGRQSFTASDPPQNW
jgi:hypothetical protein